MFIQLHFLTFYPPSNPNRDGQDRQKTAEIGGVTRMRISSQSKKASVRQSRAFEEAIGAEFRAYRTRKAPQRIVDRIKEITDAKGLSTLSDAWRDEILIRALSGKGEDRSQVAEEDTAAAEELEGDDETDELRTGQLVLISESEIERFANAIVRLDARLADETAELSRDEAMLREACLQGTPGQSEDKGAGRSKKKSEASPVDGAVRALREDGFDSDRAAVDAAMFGRMLAVDKRFSTDASVQISHGISVSRTLVEEDYFSAMDDLSKPGESGAGMLGSSEFGSAVMYFYACIDTRALIRNLGGDEQAKRLAETATSALVRALLAEGPAARSNSYANGVVAEYALLEAGSGTPRNLASAFERPVEGPGHLEAAIARLEAKRKVMNRIYGQTFDIEARFNAVADEAQEGSLEEVIAAAARAYREEEKVAAE